MKMEQACRFSQDAAGYRIVSKSPGFHAAGGLESTYNDVMNDVFGKPGRSVYSISISGNDVFLGLATLKTDINARFTIFTHAFTMPLASYEKIMEESPEKILSVSPSIMRTGPGAPPEMDAPELESLSAERLTLTAVRQKYQLDDASYAELIYNAYLALFSETSLCIDTTKSFQEALQISRELSYAAAVAMPPMLRKHLTLSSGRDNRNRIVVASGEGGNFLVPGDQMHFAAEPALRARAVRDLNEPQNLPEMLERLSFALAKADEETRNTYLSLLNTQMQELIGDRAGCPIEILLIADALVAGRSLSPIEAIYLLNQVINDADRLESMMSSAKIDEIVASLVHVLNEKGLYPNATLMSGVLMRMIRGNSGLLDKETLTMLPLAGSETQIALVDFLLDKPCTEKTRKMVTELIRMEESAPVSWTNEFTLRLSRWVYMNNVPELSAITWERRSPGDYSILAKLFADNHEQARTGNIPEGENLFNECEMEYLRVALLEMIDAAEERKAFGYDLSREDIALIGSVYPELTDNLQKIWITWLFRVYLLRAAGAEEKAALLFEIVEESPLLAAPVKAYMQDVANGAVDVFEAYEAVDALQGIESRSALARVLEEKNVFLHPGVFETKAAAIFTEGLENAFYSVDENTALLNIKTCVKLHTEASKLNLSQETKKALRTKIVSAFYDASDYQSLFTAVGGKSGYDLIGSFTKSAFPMFSDYPKEILKKKTVMDAAAAVYANPMDGEAVRTLIQVVRAGYADMGMQRLRYTDGERAAIAKELLPLASWTVQQQGILLWDLLVLYATEKNEKEEYVFNPEKLEDAVTRIEVVLGVTDEAEAEPVPLHLEESLLLSGTEADQKVVKEIRHFTDEESPRLLRDLSEALKEPAGGLLKFFGKGKKNDKK